MANFNNLTMGEKYVASKDFLMRVKAVKNLKPDFEAKDVLRAVAYKFYGNDTRQINQYLNFIKNECGEFSSLDELVEVPLDEKAQGFIDDLGKKTKEKEKAKNAKSAEKAKKESELNKAQQSRNNVQNELVEMQRKEAWKDVAKMLLLGAGLFFGASLIISAGGIAGTVAGITGFISNLTFTQTFSLAFMVFVGHGLYKTFIKNKKDKDKKGKKLKAKQEKQQKLEESFGKEKEKVGALQAEVATIQSEASAAEKEYNDAKAAEVSETANMAKYRKTSDMDMKIDFGVNALSIKFAEVQNKMSRNNASEDELKNLSQAFHHHVGMLYLDATLGNIHSVQDVEARINLAKAALEQVANPLNMNSNVDYDQSLDEIFASI